MQVFSFWFLENVGSFCTKAMDKVLKKKKKRGKMRGKN